MIATPEARGVRRLPVVDAPDELAERRSAALTAATSTRLAPDGAGLPTVAVFGARADAVARFVALFTDACHRRGLDAARILSSSPTTSATGAVVEATLVILLDEAHRAGSTTGAPLPSWVVVLPAVRESFVIALVDRLARTERPASTLPRH